MNNHDISLNIDKSKKFREFFDEIQAVREIDFLILHHVEANNAEHAIEQFIENQVSPHFLIDESGKIFELVCENNIAYHAGVSSWRGVEKLNKNSIGIEFINSEAFNKKFSDAQLNSGIELSKYLIKKYTIGNKNIAGHSDIGYHANNHLNIEKRGFLDRKQDPSHFFNWKLFAENGIGTYPKRALTDEEEDRAVLKIGDKNPKIIEIKRKLASFGYKITNFDDNFDLEMKLLVRVFHRRFNQSKFSSDSDVWYLSSQNILNEITA